MFRQRCALRGALTLAAAAGVMVSALTGTGAAQAGGAAPGAADQARLSGLLHRLTTVDGGPGTLLHLRDRRGDTVLTSGVADVDSNAPVPRDSRFRIGSMTKPFVATVVLQLAGEHRVSLDAPVERYLPGVVRGEGNDGRNITVRQLLQPKRNPLIRLKPSRSLRRTSSRNRLWRFGKRFNRKQSAAFGQPILRLRDRFWAFRGAAYSGSSGISA